MADKVLYQSDVHSPSTPESYTPKTYMAEPVKRQYARVVKQLVDTVAPGANPRRTKNRTEAE